MYTSIPCITLPRPLPDLYTSLWLSYNAMELTKEEWLQEPAKYGYGIDVELATKDT